MKIQNFQHLLVHKIQAIYDAENQAIQAMPTLIDLAHSPELKKNFQKHLEETEKQLEKLEQLCDEMNIEIEGPSNLAMEGIIDEAMEILQDCEPSPLTDAILIAAAQVIEHYEITCYGTAAEFAKKMGHTTAQNILHEIMEEEKATDQILNRMAEENINQQAVEVSGQTMGRME